MKKNKKGESALVKYVVLLTQVRWQAKNTRKTEIKTTWVYMQDCKYKASRSFFGLGSKTAITANDEPQSISSKFSNFPSVLQLVSYELVSY